LTQKHPQVPLFHLRLATTYFQLGDKLRARKSLDDARRGGKLTGTDKDEADRLANQLG
jgi:Tfp pilus assembly protein PilF